MIGFNETRLGGGGGGRGKRRRRGRDDGGLWRGEGRGGQGKCEVNIIIQTQ